MAKCDLGLKLFLGLLLTGSPHRGLLPPLRMVFFARVSALLVPPPASPPGASPEITLPWVIPLGGSRGQNPSLLVGEPGALPGSALHTSPHSARCCCADLE